MNDDCEKKDRYRKIIRILLVARIFICAVFVTGLAILIVMIDRGYEGFWRYAGPRYNSIAVFLLLALTVISVNLKKKCNDKSE
jgi:hypothetical protein